MSYLPIYCTAPAHCSCSSVCGSACECLQKPVSACRRLHCSHSESPDSVRDASLAHMMSESGLQTIRSPDSGAHWPLSQANML